MRLAWFSPWPPDPSGIAGRSAELVPALAARGHGIDVFVDEARHAIREREPAEPPAPRAVRVLGAHDFIWRHARGSYDLAVYQIGNSHLHQHIWPYLFRWPGLAVLHDGRLHHARAMALLSRDRRDDYRAEFAWNHPGVSPAASAFAIGGFDGVYQYQWPMVRSVLESSRLSATHARGALSELRQAAPDRPVEYVALGEGVVTPLAESDRSALRRARGIKDDTIVFGVFGGLTAEKRVARILRALADVRRCGPGVRLVLAGEPEPTLDLEALIQSRDLSDITIRLGRLDADAFDAWIGAVDVSLNLRWPSTLETSGPWLRALSAARPTVIMDLAHTAHVPALDPRTWQLHAPARPDSGPPVTVAIDVLDEDHSLRLAMERLTRDAGLRDRLGRQARLWWESEHTVERMADDYERVMARAIHEPSPAASGPPHLAPDPWRHTRDVLAPLGVDVPVDLSS